MSAGDSPHPDVTAELNLIESIGELSKLGLLCLPVQGTAVQCAMHKERDKEGMMARIDKGREKEMVRGKQRDHLAFADCLFQFVCVPTDLILSRRSWVQVQLPTGDMTRQVFC